MAKELGTFVVAKMDMPYIFISCLPCIQFTLLANVQIFVFNKIKAFLANNVLLILSHHCIVETVKANRKW